MVQSGKQTRLQLELLGGFLYLLRRCLRIGLQFFDRAGHVAKMRLLRLIDRAITAAPKKPRDAIRALQQQWRAALRAETRRGTIAVLTDWTGLHRSITPENRTQINAAGHQL
jgi:hypothetical protein